MSVFVQNGVSVLKSTAGHVLKFKGSEDDPVLVGTKLEGCPVVGSRLSGASRPIFERKILVYPVDAATAVLGIVTIPDTEGVSGLVVGAEILCTETLVVQYGAEDVTKVVVDVDGNTAVTYESGQPAFGDRSWVAPGAMAQSLTADGSAPITVSFFDFEDNAVEIANGRFLVVFVVDQFVGSEAGVESAYADAVITAVDSVGDPIEGVTIELFVGPAKISEIVTDTAGAATFTAALVEGREYYAQDKADPDAFVFPLNFSSPTGTLVTAVGPQ